MSDQPPLDLCADPMLCYTIMVLGLFERYYMCLTCVQHGPKPKQTEPDGLFVSDPVTFR